MASVRCLNSQSVLKHITHTEPHAKELNIPVQIRQTPHQRPIQGLHPTVRNPPPQPLLDHPRQPLSHSRRPSRLPLPIFPVFNSPCHLSLLISYEETDMAPATMAAPAVPAVWKPHHNPWAVALTVTLAPFMEVLDTSIANVALPHMAGTLGASQEESTCVLTRHLLSPPIVLPISASLS